MYVYKQPEAKCSCMYMYILTRIKIQVVHSTKILKKGIPLYTHIPLQSHNFHVLLNRQTYSSGKIHPLSPALGISCLQHSLRTGCPTFEGNPSTCLYVLLHLPKID